MVFSHSIEEHEANLCWVFTQVQKHSLKAKIKKLCLSVQKLEYLGYIASPSSITVDP